MNWLIEFRVNWKTEPNILTVSVWGWLKTYQSYCASSFFHVSLQQTGRRGKLHNVGFGTADTWNPKQTAKQTPSEALNQNLWCYKVLQTLFYHFLWVNYHKWQLLWKMIPHKTRLVLQFSFIYIETKSQNSCLKAQTDITEIIVFFVAYTSMTFAYT